MVSQRTFASGFGVIFALLVVVRAMPEFKPQQLTVSVENHDELEDFKSNHKTHIAIFYGYWCGDSQRNFGLLDTLAKLSLEKGFPVIKGDVGTIDEYRNIMNFLRKDSLYQVRHIPKVMVISDGRVVISKEDQDFYNSDNVDDIKKEIQKGA